MDDVGARLERTIDVLLDRRTGGASTGPSDAAPRRSRASVRVRRPR